MPAILSLVALGMAMKAQAAQWYVDLGGSQLTYSPAFLTIEAGDSVTFINKGGYHNVVADDGSFRCAHGCDAEGGNGNASDDLWVATITLTTPGTVGYFCEPHGAPGSGMYGTINVVASVAPVTPAPGGSVSSTAMLALVLLAAAALRLRRRAVETSSD
jgi:MYXO-CTERM domain-containing protein